MSGPGPIGRRALRAVAVAAAAAAVAAGAVAAGGCAAAGGGSAGDARPGDPLREMPGSTLFERGMALAAAGDYVRAEQYFTSAIARGYPEERAMPPLLKVCLASSRLRAALSHAEPYLARNPSAWSLRFLVASIYLGVGDVERARASLVRVIADAPDQPDPHYLLGVVLRDQVGDLPGAAQRFGRYLELAPDGDHAGEVRASLRALDAAPGPEASQGPEALQGPEASPAPEVVQ